MPVRDGDKNSAPAPWNLVNALSALESAERSTESLERKIGQLILSAAFFLTAAVALLSISEIRSFKFRFDQHVTLALPLDGIAIFIGLTFVSVMHLVTALGLPRKPRRQDDPPGASSVTWWKILDVSRTDWEDLFTKTTKQQFEHEQLIQTIYAARYTARVANHMYARAVEARGYFFVAVTVLLTSIPSILAALQANAAPSHVWSYLDASAYAAILAFALWFAGNDRFRIEADVDTLRDQRFPLRRAGYVLLALSSAAAVMATKGSWLALVLSELLLCAAVVYHYRFRRSGQWPTILDRMPPSANLLALLVMAVELLLFVLPPLRVWLLLFSYWPILIYEGIRLFDNMFYRRAVTGRSELRA